MKWFRMYNGAIGDKKWLVISKKSKQPLPLVLCVVWELMDRASQCVTRGDVTGFDAEECAAYLGVPESDVVAIYKSLENKKWITDGQLMSWSKRQPKREDSSAERTQKYREKKRTVTHGDAKEQNVTTRGEERRLYKKKLNKEKFEEFWKLYPCKTGGKQDALKAYLGANATHEEIMTGLKAYIANKEDWREWKQAGPWLRAGMWTAEYGTTTSESTDWSDPKAWHRVMKVDGKVSQWALDHYPNNWPLPGNFPDDCPPEILEEYWPEESAA